MSSYYPKSKSDVYLTPPDLYSQLHKEFNFNFDPCPHPRPAWDGLTKDWGTNARNRVKVVCSCGTTVSKGYHNRHVKRPIHQQNLITIRSAGIALPPPAGGT